ncbi:MAG: radical SAM protein [Evtepia sp.]
MSLLTTLTRDWLTRSLRPFSFKNEYDNELSFHDCDQLGLYVHIPFCKQLCSFCPYCKVLYHEKTCDTYIDYLIREIHLVGSSLTEKKSVTSLYFGGGTPALASGRMIDIISALQQYFTITQGIGLELHPDNVKEETLSLLHHAGITKISIGIQSFSDKFLSVLGRKNFDPQHIASALQKVHFETVSMDFIFALPTQTFADLKHDIETAFAIGANHIAIYPFIDFTFTDSTIVPMSKQEKRELLDAITRYCQSMGYTRDSIWTFSAQPKANYSSMTRENFLGFGCSATTLLKDQFKINTFSLSEYRNRIDAHTLPTSLTLRFTKRQRMIYFLFWTAYTTQVDAKEFEHFFGVKLKKMYGFEFFLAKKLGFVNEKQGVFYMTLKGAFYYHYYESYYTLSYIDKMWSLMKNEPFPKEIRI